MDVRRTRSLDRRGCELQKVSSGSGFSRRARKAPASDTASLNVSHSPLSSSTRLRAGDRSAALPQRSSARLWLRRGLVGLVLSAVFVSAVFTVLIAGDANRMKRVSNVVPEIENVIAFAGFGLDQVSLKGHRLAFSGDIFEALKLEGARSIASFDAKAARGRVEALSWVESAQFRRVYPNQLEVVIREREAFAVWNDGKALWLIDAGGNILARVDEARAPKQLPRFAGSGAPVKAQAFWSLVAQYPGIAERFQRAQRFGDRRWSVELVNGTTIHLPAGAASGALSQLKAWPAFRGVLEKGNAVVDMRAQGRIAVRSTVEVERTSSRPKTIADLMGPAG